MRVAVLCGGKGTRLGEPIKCLTEVAGRPFMDWKIEQLKRNGATDIWLCVGPYFHQFYERYSDECLYVSDKQRGIWNVVRHLPEMHWTMGDVLHEARLVELGHPYMEITRQPVIDASRNIAGIYTDCGTYWGRGNWELMRSDERPYHINTPAAKAETEEYLSSESS